MRDGTAGGGAREPIHPPRYLQQDMLESHEWAKAKANDWYILITSVNRFRETLTITEEDGAGRQQRFLPGAR